MSRLIKYLLIFACLLPLTCMGQTQRVEDSVKNLLDKAPNDSVKIQLYIRLANVSVSTERGAQYAIEGAKFCEDHNGPERYKIELIHIAANQFLNGGNLSKALEYYLLESKELEGHDRTGLGMSSVDMGLGNVYASQNNFQKALEYYQKGLDIVLQSKNPGKLGYTIAFYANIGGVYVAMKEYNKAIDAFKKELYILRNNHEPSYEFGNIYSSMGEIYEAKKSYDTAWAYYTRALENYRGIQMPERIASGYVNIARTYVEKEQYDAAIPYYNEALDNALKTNSNDVIMAIYEGYSDVYAKEGKFEQAYNYHKKYTDLKDSIEGLATQKQMNELETKYESATKDKELLQKDAESRRQRILTFFVMAIAIAIGVIAIIIFRSLKTTNKQKKLIEEQKVLVEVKNKEILDSITYAKRLQDAILPPLSTIKKYLPQSFVLYKPKDIIAGDFYWMERTGDTILIAAADCTGHGVPGAMVSVVCSNALNRTVKEFKITEPGKILDKVRELVLETFSKSESEVKDGMDVSLACINTQTGEVQWSGAYNSLWYIQGNELREVVADKQPIGVHDNQTPFNTHKLKLGKGDMLYLFTDGYADQFGGPKGKKFKYKQLQQLIIDNAQLTMDEQKSKLEKTFEEWKGSLEQVDDVLIIGIRV